MNIFSNRMDFADRLKEARDKKGWSATKLAKEAGCYPSYISKIEARVPNTQNPKGKFLIGLSKALGVTTDWLLTGEERVPTLEQIEELLNKATTAVTEAKKLREKTLLVAKKIEDYTPPVVENIEPIPLISLIHAGEWVEYNEDNPPQEWLPRPAKLVGKRGLAFKVEGDSMYPTLEPGEIIYVDFDREPLVGEIGVVKLHSGDSIVRRVREKSAEHYLFQACNVAYPPLSLKKSEIKHICKVVIKEFL